LLEDMTSLGTDFETHAIWQRYVEEPAAKDFIARKAPTIALRKAQGSCHRTSNNQPYSRVWKSLRDSLPKLYCVAKQGLCHAKKWSLRIFVSKKGMIHICPMDVCTRIFQQKVERGKITSSESATRYPRASYFETPTRSVPETWGCTYDVLPRSAKGKKKQDKKIGFLCSQERCKEISD
jgi:hypothetical protein